MADPQHLKWLEEGVRSWNKRRLKTPFTPDLTGAKLEGAELGGAELTDANLRGAELRRADLKVADLRGADLEGADLEGADLRRAVLRRAALGAADLRGADLRGADVRSFDIEDGRIVYSGADTRDRAPEYTTNLSTALNLTQAKLDSMSADRWTKIPDHLTRPAHWLEEEEVYASDGFPGDDDDNGSTTSGEEGSADASTPGGQSRRVERTRVAERVVADPAALAILADGIAETVRAEQTRLETGKPNFKTDAEAEAYQDRLDFLADLAAKLEALADGLAALADAAPDAPTPAVLAEDTLSTRDQIVDWLKRADASDYGTAAKMVGFWGLASFAGADMALATPIVAAVLGGRRVMDVLKTLRGKGD
ncbi:MAG: pentapeptide repeat-containing protein [Pseudomonadota bacterium]